MKLLSRTVYCMEKNMLLISFMFIWLVRVLNYEFCQVGIVAPQNWHRSLSKQVFRSSMNSASQVLSVLSGIKHQQHFRWVQTVMLTVISIQNVLDLRLQVACKFNWVGVYTEPSWTHYIRTNLGPRRIS